MYDYTIRDAISVKGFSRTLKWRTYRKEWDWAYYAVLKHIAPQHAHKALLEYFTSQDTDGTLNKYIVEMK